MRALAQGVSLLLSHRRNGVVRKSMASGNPFYVEWLKQQKRMLTESQFAEFQRWARAKSTRSLKITLEHDINGDPRTEIWAYDSDFQVGQYVDDASQIDLPHRLKVHLENETARLRALTENQHSTE